MEKTCVTCFSYGRQLFSLKIMQWLIHETCVSELIGSENGICWECHGIIIRFFKFKRQVKKIQGILQQTTKQKLQPFTSLTSTVKQIYDYEFQHTDPLTPVDQADRIADILDTDNYPENEKHNVKDEIFTEPYRDDNDLELDLGVTPELESTEDALLEVTEESIQGSVPKQKRVKKARATLKKIRASDDEEIKEKFVQIVLTEEQMVRSREEKRSQPNFKKIPYKCDTCVLGFTRKENLDLHMDKKHGESIGDHICGVCQTRFPSSKTADRHTKKHYVCYRCRLCKYETVELWSAVSHCRVKHSGDTTGSIHCAQCQFVAGTPEELDQHTRSEHTLFCNECGEKFKGKNTLRTHKSRIHATPREFICDLCAKTFVSKSRLESHLASHNAGLARRLAYCVPCGLQYRDIHAYRTHLRNSARHTQTPYSCPECNKKFASKVYWKKHYNFYHLKKSQFHCEICNKLFISDWRLKNHRQKHHGLSRSRDHACSDCGKKFYTVSTLRGHLLTHSEQRSYMCAVCGDTFKQRPALYTHARLLHGHQR